MSTGYRRCGVIQPGLGVLCGLIGQAAGQVSAAAGQQQVLAVLVVALAAVFGDERPAGRPKGQFGDEHHHLLPGAEGLFHKVKGGLQSPAGLGRGGFPLFHLAGEGLLHQAEGVLSGEKRLIGQQGGILFQPGLCLFVQL